MPTTYYLVKKYMGRSHGKVGEVAAVVNVSSVKVAEKRFKEEIDMEKFSSGVSMQIWTKAMVDRYNDKMRGSAYIR